MPTARRRLGRWLLSLILIGPLGFALGVLCAPSLAPHLPPSFALSAQTPPEQESPPPDPQQAVSALGRLEPAGGVLAISAPPGDRIAALHARPGDAVTEGQCLVVLASREDRRAELELATRQLKEALGQAEAIRRARQQKQEDFEAEKAGLEQARDNEMTVHDIKVGILRKQLEQARRQQDRLTSLEAGGRVRVSKQEKEQQQLLVSQARAEVDGAEAARKNLVRGAAQKIEAARLKLRAAQTELELAEKRLPVQSLRQQCVLARRRVEAAEVKAPAAGRVLKVPGRPGQTTDGQPVLYLAAGQGMMATAEVYQTDVGLLEQWLKDGPVEATVSSRALRADPSDPSSEPLRMTGKLKGAGQIARMVAKNQLVGLNPRADQDARVVEVRVELDGRWAERASGFVGLEVDVRFKRRAGTP